MKAEFSVEIFYEQDKDRQFAEEEAKKLRALVNELAPHIELQTTVHEATRICRWEIDRRCRKDYGPTHPPIAQNSQTLVITNEEFGAQGHGWRVRACVSKREMEKKARRGGNSAEITVHEWLHTIVGRTINGREIPNPDCNACYGFGEPSGKGPDGEEQWHDWYRYMLRAE